MAGQKKKVLIKDDTGSVSYKRSVVNSIINLATREINGIAGLNPNGVSAIKRWLSKKHNFGNFIDFISENVVCIDVYVNVYFGYSINDVAYRVQENIKSSIESMTEYKVELINVHVLGVVFDSAEGAYLV